MKTKLIILSLLLFVSCYVNNSENVKIDGIWTCYESIHSDQPIFIMATLDTNMWFFSPSSSKLMLQSYKIDNDSLYMFDQLDGYWQPSIYLPSKIQMINDSVLWLSSTPLEILVFERSEEKLSKEEFETMTRSEILKRGVPWFRKH